MNGYILFQSLKIMLALRKCEVCWNGSSCALYPNMGAEHGDLKNIVFLYIYKGSLRIAGGKNPPI